MSVTFVTAFLDLHEDRPIDKSDVRRIAFFKQIEETGIRLHVFASPEHIDKISVRNGVVEPFTLEETLAYATAPNGLPDVRNIPHDTRNFLIMMNAKTEFVKKAILSGLHSSTHYAWIDFAIAHVFRNPDTPRILPELASRTFPDRCMYVPGCTGKATFLSNVNWRFCGGFFIGDKQSLLEFHDIHSIVFPRLSILTWEVNVWAFMEMCGWYPTWVLADHDDSIIRIPSDGVVYSPSDAGHAWNGLYSKCIRGGAITRFVDIQAKERGLTAIFPVSDGLMGDDEYDRMIQSLGRENNGNIPARRLAEIESIAARPIICTLCTRQLNKSNILLLPLDDATFENGLPVFASPAWENRIPKIVWRGGSSGFDRPSIRAQAIDRLFDHPSADVRFTLGGWLHNDVVLPSHHFGDSITAEQQCCFKYILIIDGACIASNHQWVFGSGSVPVMVTHPDNDFWFRKYLVPMVNYVPVKYDLSDLVEQLDWLVSHDEEARTIAAAAKDLSNRIFAPSFQQEYIKTELAQQ
jgi:hypothetical protein